MSNHVRILFAGMLNVLMRFWHGQKLQQSRPISITSGKPASDKVAFNQHFLEKVKKETCSSSSNIILLCMAPQFIII